MNKLQRRIAGAVVAVSAIALAGGTAEAADKVEETRTTFEFVTPGVDNPCTPQYDDITLHGTGHHIFKMWVADDGSIRYQSHLNVHLAGDAADGMGYVGNDRFSAQTRIESGVAYIRADTNNRLNSQGSDPNFDVRLKVRASFALDGTSSTYEVVKDHAECRG